MKTENKIRTLLQLTPVVRSLKKEGYKIVTLNGAFDVLHPGHLRIIEEAKKQGDFLIVMLNTDNSIKRNKGPDRPINNEYFRTRMIAALHNVDYVLLFNQKTPIPYLERLKPDVHVNGSEYGENCIEAPTVIKNRGRIHIVKRIKKYSSTKQIKKCHNQKSTSS